MRVDFLKEANNILQELYIIETEKTKESEEVLTKLTEYVGKWKIIATI